MKTVAIESPLAGDFEKNRRYALWCAYVCQLRGEAAYASHLFYTQFLDDENKTHRTFGIEAGYEWAAKADEIVFFTDFGMSRGMYKALDKWRAEEKPYRFDVLPEAFMQRCLDGDYPPATKAFQKEGKLEKALRVFNDYIEDLDIQRDSTAAVGEAEYYFEVDANQIQELLAALED